MRVRRWKPTPTPRLHHIIAALIPVLIVVLSVTGFMWAQKDVTVIVDGRPVDVHTHADTVALTLEEAHIRVDSDDIVSPPRNAILDSGDVVVVRHSVPVTLDLGDGKLTRVDVVGETVADALVAAGADPAASKAMAAGLDAQLEPGMTIDVPETFVRVDARETTVAPRVVVRRDPSMPAGERRVVEPGQPGRALCVYRMLVTEGVEGTATLSVRKTIQRATPRIVAVGTGRQEVTGVVAAAAVSVPPAPTGGRRLRVEATGYSPQQPGLDSTTATGARARYGVIAVDPRVIPLGTRVWVPGYGYAVAADTGGAIKGRRIDLCYDTVAQALQWGRRTVTIIVLD